ncbi:unnamed protein product [Cuscuta campestris]|uniref:Uncharacterized protein n=1 Tax=Cuscuta campestris TaxID=132261 RepID=A0A484N1J8_9ASTE|nr:unnamed protein product [Cuscuta campestris]
MDKEQEEIQFIGFFSIFKESFSLVSTWKKIFFQITSAMIVPLSFIYLAHVEISDLIFTNILRDEYIIDRIQRGTKTYNKISDVLSSEWTAFWLFKIAYFIFFFVLALLSTSAVVYTIASIYTAKDICFKKVMSVVPKVWKRLMVTFLWSFVILFAYNVMAMVIMVLWLVALGPGAVGVLVVTLLMVIYMGGFVYITVIYHLASVVSVLEDVHGVNAMIKSQELIKGKMGISVVIFLLVNMVFFGIHTGNIIKRLCILPGTKLIKGDSMLKLHLARHQADLSLQFQGNFHLITQYQHMVGPCPSSCGHEECPTLRHRSQSRCNDHTECFVDVVKARHHSWCVLAKLTRGTTLTICGRKGDGWGFDVLKGAGVMGACSGSCPVPGSANGNMPGRNDIPPACWITWPNP